jgi:hypothetical protein
MVIQSKPFATETQSNSKNNQVFSVPSVSLVRETNGWQRAIINPENSYGNKVNNQIKFLPEPKTMNIRKQILDYEFSEVLDIKTRELIRVACAVAVNCPD